MPCDLPDFLVIGAQKSGTTTLFALLRKHPKISMPLHKEARFFSDDELYAKGVEWYWSANFAEKAPGAIAGEISPHYMASRRVPARIREAIPDVKLIAILRHPLDRAHSHYRMSVRRGDECRDFRKAFEQSIEDSKAGREVEESRAYFQLSNYADILSEYLAFFPKEQLLVVFQEDLERDPRSVLRKVHEFLGIEHLVPGNIGARLHVGGAVRHEWLRDLVNKPNIVQRTANLLLPFRVKQAIKFWIEHSNISRPASAESIPVDVLRDFDWIVKEQADFIKDAFGLAAPWGAVLRAAPGRGIE